MAGESRNARHKAIAANCAVVGFSVALLLLGLEVALAFLQVNTKSNEIFIDSKGTKHIPGSYYRITKEGFSEGYFNSHGFRDKERSYRKSENTFRILVLGDSQVEALQVALENSFPAILEKMLNEVSSGQRFEVLNLGQSGFSTADEYMRYLNFGVEYSPDLVLLAVTTANDIQDNSKYLSWESPRFYFVFDENDELVLDSSSFDAYAKSLTFPKQLFLMLKRHSYLANLISERLYLLQSELRKEQFEARAEKASGDKENTTLSEFSELNIYLPNLSPPWQDAFKITRGLFRRFRDSVEERGEKFALITLSNAEQIHPKEAERLNKEYGHAFDYEQPNRLIGAFAKEDKITLLQLMPAFRQYHLETGQYLHGFGAGIIGHWNEKGHRLAAEEIYKFLVGDQLVPTRGAM